jgi:hypothetical protein
VGTTNICELLLSVVNFNKPNVLIGLDQKVCGEEWSLNTGPSWTKHRRRRRKGPHRSEIHAEQGKPKGLPQAAGEPQGTLMVLWVKDCGKKRKPICNGWDTGGNSARRESGLTFRVVIHGERA